MQYFTDKHAILHGYGYFDIPCLVNGGQSLVKFLLMPYLTILIRRYSVFFFFRCVETTGKSSNFEQISTSSAPH